MESVSDRINRAIYLGEEPVGFVMTEDEPLPRESLMPQFLYRIQPTRHDMLASGPTHREALIAEQHFEYLSALTLHGRVLFAGRTLTTDDQAFGIVVLEVESEAEARQLMSNDPAVAHGVMAAQLWPFRVALWAAQGPRG